MRRTALAALAGQPAELADVAILTDYQRDSIKWPHAHELVADEFVIGENDDGEVFADIRVLFFYTPGERRTWDHPGCPAEIEVAGAYDKHTGAAIEMDHSYALSVMTLVVRHVEGC